MNFINLTILSTIQSITEFLPITSSGHLHLFQTLFGLQPSLTLDIFLNTATLFSVLFFFRKEVPFFFKHIKYIIVSTIPAVIVGFLAKDLLESTFSTTLSLAIPFLYTSLILFSTRFTTETKDTKMTYKKALIIGIFQSIAITPAVSRSASTIFAALLLGFSPTFAFKYSFSLFIPVSIAALILAFPDISSLNLSFFSLLYSTLLSLSLGLISLYYLRKILIHKKLYYFSFYTLFLALLLLTLG